MNEFQQILKLIEPHADVIEAAPMGELRGMDAQFKETLASIREEGRNLRIAVIGQMKSGKSSFLNAALFNQVVLPKAETPMTAALTCIVHGSRTRAEVQFYSQQDWAGIEAKAHEYAVLFAEESARLRAEEHVSPFGAPIDPGRAEVESRIDPALIACAELVTHAREMALEPGDFLGQTRVIDGVDDIGELAHALQDYVGAGGRFTPYTKMTTLYSNDPRLAGLEVIDTPGFNDPVLSRGAITRAHLARCDVIFLLSPMGQFLGASDMKVLREQLPEAGLGDKAVFLVGTQRDLPLRQDGKLLQNAAIFAERYAPEKREAATFAGLMQLLDEKMSGIAARAFDGQIKRAGGEPRAVRLLEELKAAPPRFISSWAWLLAQDLDGMSSDDRNHLQELARATGIAFDATRLRKLSNIPLLSAEIVAQGMRKRELLAAKERQLQSGLQGSVRQRLEAIRHGLAEQRKQILGGTIAELDRLEQQAVTRLEKGKLKLEDVFDEEAAAGAGKLARLKNSLDRLALDYASISAVKETKSEAYQVDTSIFGGFFGATWEKRYRDVETLYASVQDAIEKIDRYAHECIARFEDQIAGCIDLDKLRQRVSAAAMELFDTGSADFDGDLMLAGINKSLRRITIPTVELGKTDFTAGIVKQFGAGRVAEDSIDALRQAHRAALKGVHDRIKTLVDLKIDEINNSLHRSAQTFVADMSRDIKTGMHKLREQRADRETAIKEIESARRAVERAFQLL